MEPESPRETTQKLKFARPAPPKKPVKEKPTTTAVIKEEVPAEVAPSPEPSEAPIHTTPTTTTPIPRRPTPPSKPAKEKEPTTTTVPSEKTETVVQQTVLQHQHSQEDESKGAPRPSPVRRQRPQPPVKPRTNTMASTGSAGSGGEVVSQIAESAAPQPPPTQQKPVPAKRPVPRKRTVTPQQSPSRETIPPAGTAAVATKEPVAALLKEPDHVIKPSALVKEPPVPAKEILKPQAVKVSEKEEKTEPEREEVKEVTTAKVEEPVVAEKEVKPPATHKEPEISEKKEDESVVEEAAIPEKEVKPETPVALDKEEKQVIEGKVEQAAVDAEKAVENPTEEKEEKLPPTPFDDIEETDTKAAEPEKISVIQEGKKQGEGEAEKNETENLEQEDDSKYVYEDMETGTGEESENVQDKIAKSDSEYEIMNFGETEREGKAGEKEPAVGTDGTADLEEVARQQQQQRQAPGKVHQYDQVALDETEPRFKISSSASKDGTVSGLSGYEHMAPAPAVIVADKEREPSLDGEYVPMKDGVIIEQQEAGERQGVVMGQSPTDKYEYEEPSDWVEKAPPIIRDVSPPYDSLTTTRATPSPGHSRSDELTPDANVRRSVASSTGSISSQKSLQAASLEAKGGGVSDSEERRRGSSSASKKSSETGSAQLEPERDALGVRLL